MTSATLDGVAPGSPPPAPVPSPTPRERLLARMPDQQLAGWLGPVAVTLFAFALRLYRLSIPGKVAFDEVYYSCDALGLLRFGYERSHDAGCVFKDGAAFVVHPPLGKWAIALGEQVAGFDSLGWRLSAAVFGSLSVLLLCRLGRRMFRSTLLGCLAGFLLALDGLHFVQSRVAMLDIFLLFWVLAAAACLVADRDQMRSRLAERLDGGPRYPGPRLGVRWWRLAAGACLGAAVATKWSGLYYLAALGLLALWWEVGARRTAGVPNPFRATVRRETLWLLLALLVVPLAVYTASWTGWFVTDGGWRRTCGEDFPTHCGAWDGLLRYHVEMWNFHTGLTTKHPYQSRPFGWLLLARPVSYFYESPRPGTSQEILAIGTPAIWWGSVVALVACGVRWFSRRDWRAALVVVGFAAGYLPWFWPPDRTEFFFYALPSLPFMCLGIAYCAGLALGDGGPAEQGRRRLAAAAVAAYAALVAVNFFYLYPVLAARVIPYSSWQDRMWFSSWI